MDLEKTKSLQSGLIDVTMRYKTQTIIEVRAFKKINFEALSGRQIIYWALYLL